MVRSGGNRWVAERIRLAPIPYALATALMFFVLLRMLFTLFGAVVAIHADPWGPCHHELAHSTWVVFPKLEEGPIAFPLLGIWERWDGCWYIKMATYGYQPDIGAAAFFPLFPGLTWLIGTPLGGSYTFGSLAAAGLGYILAVAGLITLVRHEWGRFTGYRSALYLSTFPAAFFLFAPYTESVFLAGAIWALYGARRRRWWLAAAAAVAAGLTRTQGLLLVLPLAWEAWSAWRSAAPDGEPVRRRLVRFAPATLAVAAPATGYAAFSAWAFVTLGQTPTDAQNYWGGMTFNPPWEVITAAVRWIFERGDGIELVNVVMLVFAAAMMVPTFRLLPLSYGLYALPHVLILATRILPTPLTSTSRYVLVLFPIFIVLAIWGRDERFHTSWLIGSTLFLGMLTYLFLIGDFVA